MMKRLTTLCLAVSCLLWSSFASASAAECEGNFVNPITDICWECIFPVTIGSTAVVSGSLPDTDNPSNPLQICPVGVLYRVGLAIGYWEPMALADVTRSPYCMVNLGGVNLGIGGVGTGKGTQENAEPAGAFYHVHWYKYPLTYWLNIITSAGCLEAGDLDIAYLSELDPMWNDSSLSIIINPEAVLFGNSIAQAACAADAAASLFKRSIDALFWCAGSQGSMYPFTGYTTNEYSPLQSSLLVAERMAFKLHREGLVMNTLGVNTRVCFEYPSPIMPKSRWRYQMVNKRPDAGQCHPVGRSVMRWQAGHNLPNDRRNFGYLFWRKRNCVFL